MIPANSAAHFMAMVGCCKEQRRLTASDATLAAKTPEAVQVWHLLVTCKPCNPAALEFCIVRNNTYSYFVVQCVHEKMGFRTCKER